MFKTFVWHFMRDCMKKRILPLIRTQIHFRFSRFQSCNNSVAGFSLILIVVGKLPQDPMQQENCEAILRGCVLKHHSTCLGVYSLFVSNCLGRCVLQAKVYSQKQKGRCTCSMSRKKKTCHGENLHALFVFRKRNNQKMEKEQWLFVYICGIGVKPGALLSERQALNNKATMPSLLFAFYFETRSGLPRVALKSSSCCSLHDRHQASTSCLAEMSVFSKPAQDREEKRWRWLPTK